MTDGLGLEDVYGATIERIRAQGGYKCRLGMGALMWISYAEVSLSPDELCYALAIELGSTDFNASNIPSIKTLLSCCQGFITVDKEASTVRLIHFTLKEYLSTHLDIFARPHSAIAEICLTYLNSQQVKAIPADRYRNARDTPFLKYCSVYWGVHAKRDLSSCARSLALQLFKEYDGHISATLLVEKAWAHPKDFYTGFLWSGLHCASHFGILEVVAALIDMGCYDLNQGDCWGCTALSFASEEGHEEVVKMLLEREEVSPDKPNNYGQTPLSHAAAAGHEGVVKILLTREEVNPDMPNTDGRTPLFLAAGRGHEGVVQILLENKEVNPDKPNNYGRTPLFLAAGRGHEGVVKILLGREEVNPDRPDNRGQTPLSYAASCGCDGTVKILLGRKEVNPNKADYDGRTPLMLAARWGHQRVISLLRSHKTQPKA